MECQGLGMSKDEQASHLRLHGWNQSLCRCPTEDGPVQALRAGSLGPDPEIPSFCGHGVSLAAAQYCSPISWSILPRTPFQRRDPWMPSTLGGKIKAVGSPPQAKLPLSSLEVVIKADIHSSAWRNGSVCQVAEPAVATLEFPGKGQREKVPREQRVPPSKFHRAPPS